jgi:hypothetical protein
MGQSELKDHLASLPPWGRGDFNNDDWEKYMKVARMIQASDPATVEAVLEQFMHEAITEEFRGHEAESKLFLLMRVVFDLPETAPEHERRSFKGWVNWPVADAGEEVNLAWPLSWRSGRPQLLSSYEGSEGLPYAAALEYQHLRDHYPFRDLPEAREHA